jgi:glycosyltransferase involved in cell wall biosynthesis
MSPKIMVSISCTTYNHEKYIRQCLEGFLIQQCSFDFEILIHDDASSDKTQKIIVEYQEKYPTIIKPYFQSQNQWSQGVRGMNAKFNFSRAKGKYIALCEGDDYWIDPHKLQKQVDYLEANENYVITGHDRLVVNEENEIIELEEAKSGELYTQCILFRNVLKDDYLRNNLRIINGDTFLIYYLQNFGKTRILNFAGSVYRVHAAGIWSMVSKEKRAIDAIDSLYEMKKFFGQNRYKKALSEVDVAIIDKKIYFLLNSDHFKKSDVFKLLLQAVRYKQINQIKSLVLILAHTFLKFKI